MPVYAGKNWHEPVFATKWHKPSLCQYFANPAVWAFSGILFFQTSTTLRKIKTSLKALLYVDNVLLNCLKQKLPLI